MFLVIIPIPDLPKSLLFLDNGRGDPKLCPRSAQNTLSTKGTVILKPTTDLTKNLLFQVIGGKGGAVIFENYPRSLQNLPSPDE